MTSPRRAGAAIALALLALAGPVLGAGAPVVLPPGLVRTDMATVTTATDPARDDGTLRLRQFVAGCDLPARVLADGGVQVRVRDGADLDATIALTGCRPAGRGATCRSVDGRRRARVTPRSVGGRTGWRLTLKAKRLAAAGTGSMPPALPLRIALHGAFPDAPLNLVRDCRQRGRTLRCGASRPPNVVVVLTDDQRWDEIERMPQVQALLQAQGTTFTNAFVTTPVCCPSRASFLSGLYAHSHGTRTLTAPDGGAPGFVGADASTIATWLQGAGYRTALFGKYMNSYPDLGPPHRPSWYVPPGWSRWGVLAIPGYFDYDLVDEHGLTTHHGLAEADYSTDVTAARAVQFVDTALADDVPFLLYCAPFAPHVDPRILVASTAAPRHAGTFAALPPSRPPNWNEADVGDKPAWVQGRPLLAGLTLGLVDGNRRSGLESLLAVDEGLATLLARVDAAGARDDTVVLYGSDNGFTHGEHRLRGKLCPYEECIRVPLILRAPGIAPPGAVEPRLVENVDLAATVAAVAGVAPPSPIDGRSLLPLVMGEPVAWRTGVLVEQWEVLGSIEFFALRTETWKYVEDRDSAEVELYDLVADPWELENRAADPLLADLRATLRAEALARSVGLPGAFVP